LQVFGPGRLLLANPSELILFCAANLTEDNLVMPQIFKLII